MLGRGSLGVGKRLIFLGKFAAFLALWGVAARKPRCLYVCGGLLGGAVAFVV